MCYTVPVMKKQSHAAVFAAVVAVIALVSVACGGGKDTSDDPLVIGGAAETITMKDTSFQPGNLQVPVGAAVTWMNEDNAVHDAKAEDGSWETENLRKGESATITFDEPGEHPYYCSLHPSMKARITVVEQ